GGFDALGDDWDPHAFSHCEDGLHERCVAVVGFHALDEGPVGFDDVHGKALEESQRGIACPEVVKRDPYPEVSQAHEVSLLERAGEGRKASVVLGVGGLPGQAWSFRISCTRSAMLGCASCNGERLTVIWRVSSKFRRQSVTWWQAVRRTCSPISITY